LNKGPAFDEATFLEAWLGPGNNSSLVGLPKIVIAIRHLKSIGAALAIVMASAAEAEESHVRARLVADAAELGSGESFHLGVLLEPEPGWHVYWRNPGEAGLATEIAYALPDGFEVNELQWPVPISFEQSDGIGSYGYEDAVVLAAEVTPPVRVPSSVSVTLTASWLACKDVCILGSAKLEAELPLDGAKLSDSKRLIESWSANLPHGGDSEAFVLSVTGGPVAPMGAVDLVAWLNWKEAPGTVEFFPDPGPGLKVEGVRVQTRGKLTRIDFRISRLKSSSAPATTVRSLIVIEDDRGKRSARVTHIVLERPDRSRRSIERNQP